MKQKLRRMFAISIMVLSLNLANALANPDGPCGTFQQSYLDACEKAGGGIGIGGGAVCGCNCADGTIIDPYGQKCSKQYNPLDSLRSSLGSGPNQKSQSTTQISEPSVAKSPKYLTEYSIYQGSYRVETTFQVNPDGSKTKVQVLIFNNDTSHLNEAYLQTPEGKLGPNQNGDTLTVAQKNQIKKIQSLAGSPKNIGNNQEDRLFPAATDINQLLKSFSGTVTQNVSCPPGSAEASVGPCGQHSVTDGSELKSVPDSRQINSADINVAPAGSDSTSARNAK